MQPNKTYNYTQVNIIFKYIFENHSIAILYIHKYFMDILREANRKFPRFFKIIQRLANALVSVYCRKGMKEYNEVFELCHRILAECTDNNIRYETLDTLGIAYRNAGKNNEMLKIAEEMPLSHFSYEHFMLYHWKGDADFPKRQKYISYSISWLK